MATTEDGEEVMVKVKLSSLPLYREMILKAIEALNEENGSNKTSIAKHIESTYGELLPPGHKVLLNVHLAKMRDSGELVFWKNNYTKRDINAPLRRGRGRPPKPKELGAVAESPRPRGRPAKDRNAPPVSPKVKASGGSGRPRGRPRKTSQPDGAPLPALAGSGRPRGRPPKMKCTLTEISA